MPLLSSHKIQLIVPFCLVFTLLSLSTSWADEWTMEFSISIPDPGAEGGVFTNRIEAGIHPSATDGFDNEWDVIALTAGPVQALITHEGESGYPVHLQSLWRDIRSEDVPQAWRIQVESFQNSEPITLSWSLPPLLPSEVCFEQELSLRDETTGQVVDLFGASSLVFFSTGTASVSEIRFFNLDLVNRRINSPTPPSGVTSRENKRQIA